MLASAPVVVKKTDAKRILAQRELARRHLVDFSQVIMPWYKPGRHHILVGDYLEAVDAYVRSGGKEGIGRLLIMQPPRHGKSEQASIHFPAWFLGRNPDCRIICASYGLDLASDFSRKCRDIVLSDKYKRVFGSLAAVESPVELSTDSRSVKAWDLAFPHRGGMTAAGAGGGITGKGAHLFILDDPIKNREEAESEAHRDALWEWWTSTARTRLEDGAAVVASLTHWHADDWAGRVIKKLATEPDFEQWKILWLPAIWENPLVPDNQTFIEYQLEQMKQGNYIEENDLLGRAEGEALWPEKYSPIDLAVIEKAVEPYNWASLYQQRTYLRSGNLFKRDWFTIVDTYPSPDTVLKRIRVWDKAGTKTGQGGDYAAGVRMSITQDDVVYVEHLYFEQCTPLKREEAMKRLAMEDRNVVGPAVEIWHQQDPGSAGLDSAQQTNMNLAKAGVSAHFDVVSGEGSKEIRAGAWSSACEAGRVRLIRGSWNDGFIERHVGFPKHRFDDDVDAASWGFSKLTRSLDVKAVDNLFYGAEV